MGAEVNKPPTILIQGVPTSAQEGPVAGGGRVSEPSIVLLQSVLTCVGEPRRLIIWGSAVAGFLGGLNLVHAGLMGPQIPAPGVSAEWRPLVSTLAYIAMWFPIQLLRGAVWLAGVDLEKALRVGGWGLYFVCNVYHLVMRHGEAMRHSPGRGLATCGPTKKNRRVL